MRHYLQLAVLLLVAVAMVGCAGGGLNMAGGGNNNGGGGNPGPGSLHLSVSGTLVDDGTRTALAGAIAAAQGQTVFTATDGAFVLNNLATNPVELTLSANGYLTINTSVTVAGDSLNVGTVGLIPAHVPGTGDATGTVLLNGAAASGATISVLPRLARTVPQGTFTIYNLPAGTLTLTVTSADRTASALQQVTIVADDTVSAGTISLSTGPPAPPN